MKTTCPLLRPWCLPAFFLLFLSSEIFAQQQEEKPRDTYSDNGFQRLAWDVSTDLKFLLNDNYNQGDILVRKNKANRMKD